MKQFILNKTSGLKGSEIGDRSDIKIRAISQCHEFEKLRFEWKKLLADSSNNVVQLTHEWMTAWWNSFGENRDLFTLLVYGPGNELIGIAPLMKYMSTYRGKKIKKISLTANGYSPSCDIITTKRKSAEVIGAIFDYVERSPDWDILDFTKMYEGSPNYPVLLNYLVQKNIRFGIKDNIEIPYILINSEWGVFYKERTKRFRKTLRNKLNRADRTGGLTIERIPIDNADHNAIEEMITISKRGWKKNTGTDLGSCRNSRKFHFEICERFGPLGMVTLWFLKKDGKPIAFEFHLNYNDTVYPIRADYDETFKHISPGSMLEFNIIRTLFLDGKVKEYNTCGHTYDYLFDWTGDTRKHFNVEVFNRKFTAYSLYVFEYKLMPFLRKFRFRADAGKRHHF